MIAPGDVRFVWFPFSHGEAQPYKKRPVLVLGVAGNVPDQAILVAMITANAQRISRPHPRDVILADWQGLGLKKPSVVRARRIWTAEGRDFAGPAMGRVTDDELDLVRQELRKLIG